MIEVPKWLLATQWALLFALLLFLTVLFRQLGHLMNVARKTETTQAGLDLGAPAPDFSYEVRTGDGVRTRWFRPRGQLSLLMFAEPGCTACEQALDALVELEQNQLAQPQVLIATVADWRLVDALEAFRTAPFTVARVERDVPARHYSTLITPFVHVIGEDGLVLAKGSAATAREIRNLLRNAHHHPKDEETFDLVKREGGDHGRVAI